MTRMASSKVPSEGEPSVPARPTPDGPEVLRAPTDPNSSIKLKHTLT
ncbi:hypothetical protein GGE12_005311 [Rhizobium mongolense]|uniref:Uncharacterized protein n=1 Tax=Rhizobium mongolense TaxID=57676 RepID=A0A7W6WH69_9HYPH|nr:hypothetical protein [Rhizobium mongolense]